MREVAKEATGAISGAAAGATNGLIHSGRQTGKISTGLKSMPETSQNGSNGRKPSPGFFEGKTGGGQGCWKKFKISEAGL
jgi:hypothetical protein